MTLDPFALAVLPGTDDMPILGWPTVKVLSLDIYAGLKECVRWKVERRAKLVENDNYIVCQYMSLSVKPMQQQLMGNGQIDDQAVERVVEGGPEMVMEQSRRRNGGRCWNRPRAQSPEMDWIQVRSRGGGEWCWSAGGMRFEGHCGVIRLRRVSPCA